MNVFLCEIIDLDNNYLSYHSVVILEVHCKLRGESMFDNCYESLSAVQRPKASLDPRPSFRFYNG